MRNNKLLLFGLIIFTGIFASYYGGNISYALFYMALSIPTICIFYTFYVFVRFKMYQVIGKRTVVKGEVTEYQFRLSNEDFISYQNIKVNFFHDKSTILGSEQEHVYSLLPGEKQSIETAICCNYRGEYYVGAETVTITDFLYIFSITYPVFSKMRVRVLPRIISLPNIKMISANTDSKCSLNHISSQDEEADIEVRKYVSGDNRKRIHWKASAKKRELFTRKYINLPQIGIVVFVDLQELHEDNLTTVIVEDKILETSLAVADYCQRKHILCEVHYDHMGMQNIKIKSQLDFDFLYHQCIDLHFTADKPIEAVIVQSEGQQRRLYENQLNQSIIITHQLTNELYKVVLQILSYGNACGILFINEQLTSKMSHLIRLFTEAGVVVTQIQHKDEIAEVL